MSYPFKQGINSQATNT